MPQQSARVFNDRYEIDRRIARGGMAEVYLAHDLLLDRPVALKVLFAELAADPNFVERFRREAQAAANLSHPNIVSIYDWGEEDGTYFIVMEFIDGQPLSALIREEGTLPPSRAADIGADVAAALAFAHRNGVVHRDVKPGNVLIDESGTVKVTDFGIARAVDARDNLTQTGTVMGTATYFSPEQAQGYGVDNRSDVYSLGVVLYEMVTGEPPFTGENPVSVAYRHVREAPPPPRQLNPNVPAGFEAVVLQSLAKDPDERYANAEDLRSDLMRFRRGRSVLARPPRAAGIAAAGAEDTTSLRATTAQPRAGRTSAMTQVQGTLPAGGKPPTRSGVYVALLLGMLAVLGVLLYLLARSLGVLDDSAKADIPVPPLVGMTQEEATTALERLELEAEVDPQFERNTPPGQVFAQDPQPGSLITKGASVTIRVSRGVRQVPVPEVVGQGLDQAQRTLTDAGLTATVTRRDSDEPADRVLDQTPDAGTEVAEGSAVRLTVSSGRTTVAVPNVVGLDEGAAVDRLQEAGFRVRRRTEASTSVDQGDVIRTTPPGGAQAEKGSTVEYVVSTGPENVEVPNVVGDSEADATAKLQAAGFTVSKQTQTVDEITQHGRVISQSPSGGARAPKGATVTITVGEFSP